MRIGYDGKFLWSDKHIGSKSGHGIQSHGLLRGLLEEGPEHEFVVQVLGVDDELPRAEHATYQVLPDWARSSTLRNVFAFAQATRREPVDVLLSYTTAPFFVPCKRVLILDDISWLAHPEWFPRDFALPRTVATRLSVRLADHIVSCTEFSKRELVRLLDVDPARVTVAPLGTQPSFADPVPEAALAEVRRKHGIERPYLFSLNDLQPRKNLEGIVRAFDRLCDWGHEIDLVIAGRPLWEYPAFDEALASSRHRDRIRMAGYVDAEDVAPLYQGARAFVYASYYEGWGLQTHEAMAAGVPVAVTRDSAMAEISEGAAVTFDPHDAEDMAKAIERLLGDDALRERLIADGRRVAGGYGWRRTGRITLDVCERVLGA